MTITTTSEHPFYVKGRGFVRADSLGIGTHIVTRAGPGATVTATRIMTRVAGYTVYNLTLDGDHTYFVGKMAGGVWVHNATLCELIAELIRKGVKVTPGNVVDAARRADGTIVFLEKGNPGAGLEHILIGHEQDFIKAGIPASEIPDAVVQAAADGKIVGYQGGGPTPRPIYEILIGGVKKRIAVTVSANGFIVGANPA